MAKKSSKRFYLVHVFGAVEPAVLGKSHKTYDGVAKAARKFIASDDFEEGRDNVFYIVTENRRSPRIGSFDSIDLEDDDILP